MLSVFRAIVSVSLLVLQFAIPAGAYDKPVPVSSSGEITADSPLADCSVPCKRYNEWVGGTTGAWEDVQVDETNYCWSLDCYIYKGMWIKNTSTGTYIFAGEREDDRNIDAYISLVWKPKAAYETYWTANTYGDYKLEVTVFYDPSVGYNNVSFYAFGTHRSITYGTTATESLWDVIQTGERLKSPPNASYQVQYYTHYHHWRCGSCGNTWQFQTADGTRRAQGANVTEWSDWWSPLPSWSSDGGTYYQVCPRSGYPSSCP